MYLSLKKNLSKRPVLNFTYPVLHTGKDWYIDFKSFDPATGTMRRKKYMLNHVLKKGDRRKMAAEMMESLLKQLRSGWSPWITADKTRGYTLLSLALEKYEKNLEKLPKEKTRHSYKSRLNVLREFIDSRILPPKYVYQYDTAFVSDFLDWLYLDREVGGRTRNNYRGWCSSLASFFIEREYIEANPVNKIKSVPEEKKIRQPLPPAMLQELRSYLIGKDKYFLLACMIEYYTMIRPSELVNIKIDDIRIKEQSIFVAAEHSKNKRDGKVGINEDIISLMLDIDLFSHPGNFYIFASKMRPGTTKGSSEMFRKEWNKMKSRLRWSNEFQFYSLKDSGIRDLANSEGIIVARDQARHTDVATTNKYLQGRNIPIHDATKHFKGYL